MKYIIGNWKSNLNRQDISPWFEKISGYLGNSKININVNNLTTVVCPPFIYLPEIFRLIKKYKLPFQVGAQNISMFSPGAYTGEVNADQIREYVSFVLIGHSERRKYFGEDDKVLIQKVKRAREAGINPVYCVSRTDEYIPPEVEFVAYEPLFAIGTGKADTGKNANQVAQIIKKSDPNKVVIYGGSVIPDNLVSFLTEPGIDGVLPGKASLDPLLFGEMLTNASKI